MVSETDEKEQYTAKDVFVHIPLGAVLYAKDRLPDVRASLSARRHVALDEMRSGSRKAFSVSRSAVDLRRSSLFSGEKEDDEGFASVLPVSSEDSPAKGKGLRSRVSGMGGALRRLRGGTDTASATVVSVSPSEAPILPPRSVGVSSAASTPAKQSVGAVAAEVPVLEEVDLAIQDYDTLTAMQVAQRLNGLTDEELLAIRNHEAAHRSRKTILGKIDTLFGE